MSRELGLISVLGADAIGQPGERRFRIFAESRRGSVVLWMEKEQLNSLSLALDRFMSQITEGQVLRVEARAGGQPVPEGMPADFPLASAFDFQVGQMKLHYDEYNAAFILSATPLEIVMEPGEEPKAQLREDDTVSFIFTQQDAQELASTIARVIESGRPVCPLCHAPLDGGPHACVRQNGHREIF
ncbi:DUF3090 family protein [Ktedonosporobacter rubrisoli]|uniref:DUF3090 family protein n=1 Tax=Ktedonosporobacter rubrisoli TaxID=2509675 RepID=A0A4P6JWL3_KTERU|nr:DUF3090 family protein [Ktedonosporobacter rubrisoli]QBD79770.1 DUF3090 family protein [Ktedonosporobacter rubrisoli]